MTSTNIGRFVLRTKGILTRGSGSRWSGPDHYVCIQPLTFIFLTFPLFSFPPPPPPHRHAQGRGGGGCKSSPFPFSLDDNLTESSPVRKTVIKLQMVRCFWFYSIVLTIPCGGTGTVNVQMWMLFYVLTLTYSERRLDRKYSNLKTWLQHAKNF